MRRTVAVGVDGSPESLAAADWAAREAVRRRVPLRLVNAAAPAPGLAGPADPHSAPVTVNWSPYAVADELRRAHPAAEITVDQIAGQALPVLFAAADEAALVVLGSRGVGAAAGFLLGSVALTVAGQAPVPVVLVRAARTSEARGGGDVVLGLDLVRPGEGVLRFAFDAAARRSGTLRVVHGWSQGPPAGPDAGTEVLAAALAPWREHYPQVRVSGEAVTADPAHHLLAASADAALLVLGRHEPPTRLSPHLGPTTHTVLHQAPLPVAVIPAT